VERKQLAVVWNTERTKLEHQFKLVIHVGSNSLEEAKELASHAQEIKVDAIAAMPPCFFKPASVQLLVQTMAVIANSAPLLPFYYYHIPSMTGVRFRMIDFLKLASTAIPNLAGIKYSDPNLMDFAECVNLQDQKYNMLFGSDEMLVGALSLGAHGAVGSTYNIPFMMPYYLKLWESFEKGDIATSREQQKKSIEVVDLYIKYGPGTLKALLKLSGLDLGSPRLPLTPLTKEELENLHNDCIKLNFLS